jgi:fatty acid desaturase
MSNEVMTDDPTVHPVDAHAVDDEALDAEQPVLLAPVRGTDIRRNLPKTFFPKKPSRFVLKFHFALGLIAASYLSIALSKEPLLIAAAILVSGVMYAHLVELQHECLHEHAFRSRRLNRVYGIVCGLFMFSSYSYYKFEHLRHHASLGKPNNREFFNYRFRALDSLPGFLRAAFHLGRYVEVFGDMGRSLTGRPIDRVNRPRELRRIQAEYRLFAAVLVAVVAFTVVTGNLFFVWAWLIPLLLVAEPAHFLIEMPEHFGLNTQTDPNVLANTRTIRASRFAQWLTNYNNLHTAHHFHQGVPMVNIEALDGLVKDRYEAVEPSYWSFYRKVIQGEIRYRDPEAETCMTR